MLISLTGEDGQMWEPGSPQPLWGDDDCSRRTDDIQGWKRRWGKNDADTVLRINVICT